MNIFEELGALALATRLKLLGESLAKDVGNIYNQLDIKFEPRWFTLFWMLKQNRSMVITELAKELRQTHAAIVQLTTLLEKKGLLASSKDKNDERRRQVSLTPKGIRLFEEVEPVLNAIKRANEDLLQLAAPDFLNSLSLLERALDQKSMYERVSENLGMLNGEIHLKSYSPEYKDYLYTLTKQWMEECFGSLEEKDTQVLLYPEKEIISRGGDVFFALHGEKVVGTAAILETHARTFQLAAFTVAKELRGTGIGKALYEKVKAYALSKGGLYVSIFLSPLLPDGINFFIKNGFTVTPLSKEEQAEFRRPILKMQVSIKQ